MKTISHFLLLSFLTVTILSSCKRTENSQYIPADSDFVGIIDITKIGIKSKMHRNESFAILNELIAATESSKEDISVLLRGVIQDRNESGINIKQPLYVYSANNGQYVSIIAAISDKSKFADYLELNLSDTYTKETIEDITIYTDEHSSFIAFKKNTAFFIMKSSVYSPQFAKNLFTTTAEKSMNSNKHFKDFSKNASDISFYISAGKLISSHFNDEILKSIPSLSSLSIEDISEAGVGIDILFDADAIVFETKIYADGNLENKIKKISDSRPAFSQNLLNCLPAENLILFASSFDVNDILSMAETNSTVKSALAMAETNRISPEALLRNFNGSIVFGFYDLGTESQEISTFYYDGIDEFGIPIFIDTIMIQEKTVPKAIMAFGLKDSKSFQMIIDGFGGAFLQKNQGYYTLNSAISGYNAFLALHNNMLIISTDEAAMKQIESGGFSKNFGASKQARKVSNNGYSYINLDYDTYPESIKKLVEMAGIQSFISEFTPIFKSIEMVGTSSLSSTVTIQLKSGKDNSLYQVLKSIDAISNF